MHLTISVDREPVTTLTATDLEEFELEDLRAGFHCVTTWSVKNVVWTGVPFHRIAASLGLNERSAPYLVSRAVDNRRGHFLSADAFAADVLLATRLNGTTLDARHGPPLRLVAPQHYAYKSIKHLTSIDLRTEPPNKLGKEHLRGRVSHQKRHPKLPSWLVKTPYRLLIAPTAYLAERSLERSEPRSATTS